LKDKSSGLVTDDRAYGKKGEIKAFSGDCRHSRFFVIPAKAGIP
jgi:hypothetical protein